MRIVVLLIALAAACSRAEPADRRLVGRWELIVDPARPQHYFLAEVRSGELVFAEDRTATRKLVVEGRISDGSTRVVTHHARLRDVSVAEEADGRWLVYRSETGGEGRVRMDELTADRLSVFDWEDSHVTFRFRRAAP